MLGPGACLMEKEFTGSRSHKDWETLLCGMFISFNIVLESVLNTCTKWLLKRSLQSVERELSSVAAISIARSSVSTGLGLQKGDCPWRNNYRRPLCSTLSLVTQDCESTAERATSSVVTQQPSYEPESRSAGQCASGWKPTNLILTDLK